ILSTSPYLVGQDNGVDITIIPSSNQTQNVIACNSYTWPANSTTYTSSGTYTIPLTNINGCDSIVTLNLTINNSSTGSETVTTCNSYTWSTDGNTYITTGVYTATITNSSGCDSVVTLNLTINNDNTGSQT